LNFSAWAWLWFEPKGTFVDGLFTYLANVGLIVLLLIAFAVAMHFFRARRKDK
jgi:hypothetical protein